MSDQDNGAKRPVSGYLLVRTDGTRYGLPIDGVVEVVDGATPVPVPAAQRSVRGAANLRGRMVPVVHLGALLAGSDPPQQYSNTVVLVRCLDKPVAFEVDDADEVVREEPTPMPPGRRLPWASGIANQDDALVPILDLDALGERLSLADGDTEQ